MMYCLAALLYVTACKSGPSRHNSKYEDVNGNITTMKESAPLDVPPILNKKCVAVSNAKHVTVSDAEPDIFDIQGKNNSDEAPKRKSLSRKKETIM